MTMAVFLFAPLGCQKRPTLPETYPVRGKVVFQGGRPVIGGGVRFESQIDPAVTAFGEIGPDGGFSLHSFNAGVRASGAIAGPHRVLVTAPIDQNQSMSFPPTSLSTPCVVKAGDNEFTLVVDQPPKNGTTPGVRR